MRPLAEPAYAVYVPGCSPVKRSDRVIIAMRPPPAAAAVEGFVFLCTATGRKQSVGAAAKVFTGDGDGAARTAAAAIKRIIAVGSDRAVDRHLRRGLDTDDAPAGAAAVATRPRTASAAGRDRFPQRVVLTAPISPVILSLTAVTAMPAAAGAIV